MIEFEKYMVCQYCYLLLEDPFESKCCGKLFCKKCTSNVETDNCCKCYKIQEFRQNTFVKRILNQMTLFCFFNCGEKLHSSNLRRHMIYCQNREYRCHFCDEIGFYGKIESRSSFLGKKKNFLQHLIEFHSEKILDFHENIQKDEKYLYTKIDYYQEHNSIKEEKKEDVLKDYSKPFVNRNQNYLSFLDNVRLFDMPVEIKPNVSTSINTNNLRSSNNNPKELTVNNSISNSTIANYSETVNKDIKIENPLLSNYRSFFSNNITNISTNTNNNYLKYGEIFSYDNDNKIPFGENNKESIDKILKLSKEYKESGLLGEIKEREVSLNPTPRIYNYNDFDSSRKMNSQKNIDKGLFDKFEDRNKSVSNFFVKDYYDEVHEMENDDIFEEYKDVSIPENEE